MPTYLSPGVYVEEVDSGSRPIEGVGHRRRRLRRAGRGRPVQRADPGAELDRVRPQLRRLRRGLVPRPIRLRLLPERRRQLLRRPHRPGEQPATAAAAAAGDHGRPAGHARHLPGGRARRRHRRRAPSASTSTASRVRAPEGLFKLVVRQGDQVLEEYDRLNTGRGKANVATAVNAASKVIRIEETATGAVRRGAEPRRDSVSLYSPPPPAAVPSPAAVQPTTTSATSPSAPASPAWRPSTRSPWSASPT